MLTLKDTILLLTAGLKSSSPLAVMIAPLQSLEEKSMLSAAPIDAAHLLLKDMMRNCVPGKLFDLLLTFYAAELIHVLSPLATVCMFLGVDILVKLADTTL